MTSGPIRKKVGQAAKGGKGRKMQRGRHERVDVNLVKKLKMAARQVVGKTRRGE